MILINLSDADVYKRVHPRLARGLEYLESGVWKGQPDGNYELEKDGLYANLQRYRTIPLVEARWEAHRIYTDIQFIVSGVEQMGCGSLTNFSPATEYDAEHDVSFFNGSGDFFAVPAGSLAIFFPHDVHMPRVIANEASDVYKIVMKVRVD